MRPKSLFSGVVFLAVLPGCGSGSGDPSSTPEAGAGSAAAKPAGQIAPAKETPAEDVFASLLEPGYSSNKLRVDLGGVGLQEAEELQRRLETAVGRSDAAIGKLRVEMQRFAADALVSGDAQAAQDSLEVQKRTRVSLRNKLLVLARHIATRKAAAGK